MRGPMPAASCNASKAGRAKPDQAERVALLLRIVRQSLAGAELPSQRTRACC